MPVSESVHVFASHKGGTGKTQLCFQCATQYANEHPEKKVLVMDMTELGDLSKRCMGGAGNEQNWQHCFGKMFELIQTAGQAQRDEEIAEQGGMFARLTAFFRKKAEVDIPSTAIHVKTYNPVIPSNVYLISSGATSTDEEQRTTDQTIEIANQIRLSLEKTSDDWKLFLDTDGDRRVSPSTRLAYALGDNCIIPIQPDFSDFARIEPMFACMQQLYDKGEMRCRIQLVIWNKLQLYRKEPSELGSFTVPKVTADTIQSLNGKLWQLASKTYPNLFFNGRCNDEKYFAKSSTCLVRDFPDTCAYPANAKGLPYCLMQAGKIKVDSCEFAVKKDQIDSCVENVTTLLAKMEMMEVDEGAFGSAR